jgi:hypothetical protein
MKQYFEDFLKEQGLLPLESNKWNKITVDHTKESEPISRKSEVKRKISKTVKGLKGVYVYKYQDQILYVGEGILERRLRRHYNESYKSARSKRTKKWHDFFGSYRHVLDVYYLEVQDKYIRKTIEAMLTVVLEPEYIKRYG